MNIGAENFNKILQNKQQNVTIYILNKNNISKNARQTMAINRIHYINRVKEIKQSPSQ